MAPIYVKCLVWDLDNTLWQGTLLEDGEVRLAEEIREVIHTLDSRGILQSIASRNDHDVAWQRLVELGVAEYFVVPRISWDRKSDSVRAIADQLGFAHGTIAFIDDMPHERSEVSYHLADVRCYPAEQATELPDLPEFSPAVVTEDSRRRRRMYQESVLREAEKESFTGPDEDFLRSLKLRLSITRASAGHLARVEELTLRTSQMNATGVHYSQDDLTELLSDPGHEVLTMSLTDRFGPHGSIGVMLLEKHAEVWQLKLLATSCRVVAFGAGATILNWLVDQAARAGVHLIADFRRTDRNRMMDIAYRFAGFTDDACPCATELKDAEHGVERLHLVPERRSAPSTMVLEAPQLGRGRTA